MSSPASRKTYPIATVTDCKSFYYGQEVIIQSASGTLRLVQPVRGGAQTLISKIHLRIDDVGGR
jgi:hypothetical protein